MTVGEFTRKLKEAVKAEGYTSNNVNIMRIDLLEVPAVEKPCIRVMCVGNNENEFNVYVEED